MILFAAYLQRRLRRRRAARGVPPRPAGSPGLARMIFDEVVVLMRRLTGGGRTGQRRRS
ncbi:MAG: hypothetical protein M3N68_13260 [Actinomycetota bacterium]|nr:hypothetical protein [Actinomycetota bacterium]